AARHFVLRKHGISTWKVMDVIAPAIAVGVGLGRVGCLLNGCCYGDVACAGCPAVTYPLSAPPRHPLVHRGYQPDAGFTLTSREQEPVRVKAVQPGSAVEQSGLRPGDRIVEVNGNRIENGLDLYHYLGNAEGWGRGEADLEMKVTRAGEDGE